MESVPVPDYEIELGKLRSGDQAFFHALFMQNYETLVEIAHGIVRSRAVGEEIAQEAFLHLWQQRNSIQIRSTIRVYLIGVVRNKAISYVRHDRLVQSFPDSLVEESKWMGTVSISADDVLAGAEFDAALRHAIMHLP